MPITIRPAQQYRAASGRDHPVRWESDRRRRTPGSWSTLVRCSIFYCESPVPVCFIVHSSQIAVTGRERGRGTIILHGRRSTSCCPLSGKETVRTAAIGQRSRTLKVNFELWSVSAGRGGQWGGPRHKYASEGLCVLPGWQINVNVTVTATLTPDLTADLT